MSPSFKSKKEILGVGKPELRLMGVFPYSPNVAAWGDGSVRLGVYLLVFATGGTTPLKKVSAPFWIESAFWAKAVRLSRNNPTDNSSFSWRVLLIGLNYLILIGHKNSVNITFTCNLRESKPCTQSKVTPRITWRFELYSLCT